MRLVFILSQVLSQTGSVPPVLRFSRLAVHLERHVAGGLR